MLAAAQNGICNIWPARGSRKMTVVGRSEKNALKQGRGVLGLSSSIGLLTDIVTGADFGIALGLCGEVGPG